GLGRKGRRKRAEGRWKKGIKAPRSVKTARTVVARISSIRPPSGLPRSGGHRVAPPKREPRSGGSQVSPGEGPKVRTPGWQAEGPHPWVAGRRSAPLGGEPKVRTPGCEAAKSRTPRAIRLTHRSTTRIPANPPTMRPAAKRRPPRRPAETRT